MSTEPDDPGDMSVTIRVYRQIQVITIDLHDPLRFLVLTVDQARDLAETLLAAVRELLDGIGADPGPGPFDGEEGGIE